jgi:hypothetical protein
MATGALVILAVIPPRTTPKTGGVQTGGEANLTSEDDTIRHPMDGWEATHNRWAWTASQPSVLLTPAGSDVDHQPVDHHVPAARERRRHRSIIHIGRGPDLGGPTLDQQVARLQQQLLGVAVAPVLREHADVGDVSSPRPQSRHRDPHAAPCGVVRQLHQRARPRQLLDDGAGRRLDTGLSDITPSVGVQGAVHRAAHDREQLGVVAHRPEGQPAGPRGQRATGLRGPA